MNQHRSNFFERAEVLAGATLFVIFAFSFSGGCVFALASLKDAKVPGPPANPGYFLVTGSLVCLGELASGIFIARTAVRAKPPILLNLVQAQFRLSPVVQATWWLWHFMAMAFAPEVLLQEIRRS